VTALVLLVALGSAQTRGEAVEEYLREPSTAVVAFDPTDPTRPNRGLILGAEWVSLARSEGDIVLFHLGALQPLGPREQWSVEFDLPFGWSDTRSAGTGAGLGDIRLAGAWRPWTAEDDGSFVRGIALRCDVLVPTGSGSRSLGADSWVYAPAVSAKFGAGAVSAVATARWLAASSVNVAGIRGFNVPGVDALSNTTSRSDLDALNLELAFAWEFDRRTSPVHWFAITPDWTFNRAGDRNDMLILKTRLGRGVAEGWSFDLDFWFPVLGERTQSFTLRFAFVWEF